MITKSFKIVFTGKAMRSSQDVGPHNGMNKSRRWGSSVGMIVAH